MESVEAFNGTEWITLPDMNEPRLGPALAVVQGKIYAIGGVCDRNMGGWGAHGGGPALGSNPFTARVERLELPEGAGVGEGRWVVCESMKAPTAFHACFAAGLTPLYD